MTSCSVILDTRRIDRLSLELDSRSTAVGFVRRFVQRLPDSLAYEITKLVLEDNKRMQQIHKSAVETLAENWDKNNFMPFHPGAVKYYEEIGIEIPETLR